MLSHAIKILIV